MIHKILSLLIISHYVAGFTSIDGKEFKDCSYKFKNRMATFGDYLVPNEPSRYGIGSLGERIANARDVRTDSQF